MSDSPLSFASSASFRDTLIARNLAPYSVQGSYSPPSGDINYQTNLTVTNVIDSPNELISTNIESNILYPLNEYGPEGGYNTKYSVPGAPYPINSNQGEYNPTDTVLDLVNEFFIDAAYTQNSFGPEGGYKDMVIVTDLSLNNKIYLPYWTPPSFVPSIYSPYEILSSTDPTGSNGSLSQDSYLVKIGAAQLKGYFEERIQQEIIQLTVGSINLDTIQDPFSASLLASGQQPFFIKNWKITVPEFPPAAAVSFANRLTGTYFPVSFIPGDYFSQQEQSVNPQVEKALNVVNNLTGGFLGPILKKFRNPSEIFVANTGNGQRSVLFRSLDYNVYKPYYNRGILNETVSAITGLFGQDTSSTSRYYVGSNTVEPSFIESPPNQLPVNKFGKQVDTIVYGPSELAQLYEGNEGKINFGLQGKSYTNDGGIDGQFIWTSPKYKGNAGFKVGVGGDPKNIDDDFNQIQSQYNRNQSTDIEFKGGSILDQTQRLVESADNVTGKARLKHVGNAINQVSKVFNDGYKELTKGSQVLSYTDNTNGTEAGIEYCRVFAKDTPYYTYNDLQKSDGITKSGRKFEYSIFDNTYNLNIAPLRGNGSTNIVNGKVKKYMFSLENLAWRTSDQPGFTYDDLPVCERGPNGGRIMWFPPYDLSFSDNSKPDFNGTNFLGRPEPIYTYKNTSRSGQLSWKIIVDSPSSLNTIIEKQLANVSKERIDSIIDSFFAGCVKYDIYELATKFNTIPTKDLYTYQEILNNPRLTEEEMVNVIKEIPTITNTTNGKTDPSNTGGNKTETKTADQLINSNELDQYIGYGFYFENDIPQGNPNTTATSDFETYYNQYVTLKTGPYVSKAPNKVYSGVIYTKDGIQQFFTDVVEGNFNSIKGDFMKKIEEVLIKKKGKITITLRGSASAPNKKSYNNLLSQRRVDSVIKWFKKQKFSDGTNLSDLIGKTFIITTIATGEETVIPCTSNGQGEGVNCTTDIREGSSTGPITSNAQWYSVPAMVCRRVGIETILAQVVPDPKPVVTPTPQDNSVIQIEVPPLKPLPQVDVLQTVKEGISKKILRNLFTECDYFEVIKQSNPMVFDSFKDKIKYFNPAFHSMTPEGLNSRLTFLNQCVRPGQTIPVIGPDGRPKYNDARNTSFGAPPILVLRIGDFYHTKIVPTSLDITYEPLIYDLNPEGIGVQPMIAKISMSFNIIGGMGLKEPVDQLQNALSFNYYANTEIYDERAVATEDVSARDKNIVANILSQQLQVTNADVQNNPPQKGLDTIGSVLSATTINNGSIDNGQIEYNVLISDLSDSTSTYFKTTYNQLKTLQNVTNYGILQLVNTDRKFDKGVILKNDTTPYGLTIYGKTDFIDENLGILIKRTVNDIDNNSSPIINQIWTNNTFNNNLKRDLKQKMQNYVKKMELEIANTIIGPVNEITSIQQELVQVFKKMDAITYQIDGKKQNGNSIKVYNLSGITGSTEVIDKMKNVYKDEVGKTINDYYLSLLNTNIIGAYDKIDSIFNPSSDNNELMTNNSYKRFYMVMAQTFLDITKYNNYVNYLTDGDIKNNVDNVNVIKSLCESFRITCQVEFNAEKKIFEEFEKSPDYQKYINFKILEFETKLDYTTADTGDDQNKLTIMQDVYSNVNTNGDRNTFNGKVKFS